MENLSPTLTWNAYQKISFRFAFLLIIQFIVFFDWSVNPILSHLYYEAHLAEFLDTTISWTGKNLFKIEYTIVSPYDGQHNDRTYVFLLYFNMAMVSLLGAMIWSALDRNRSHYQTHYYWLTVFVRYYLAFTLFLFALEKFFKLQFPDLGYNTLTEQLGDMSPMSLAWAFFGYSYGYNVVMGIAESAALLLLFRRTTTLGALLTLATLANVMAVNYNYDVHAKLYPTSLFALTLFLLLKDLTRLLKFFLTGQAVALPIIPAPVFKMQWMNTSKILVKVVVIGYFTVIPLMDYIGYKKRSVERTESKSHIAGLYEVDTFVVNMDTLSDEHPLKWKQLTIGDKMLETVRFSGDSIAFLQVSVDPNELIVSGNQSDLYVEIQKLYDEFGLDSWELMDSLLIARNHQSRFIFEISEPTVLKLKGLIKTDSVFITAHRKPIDIMDFRLMKRRFHWINEAAYLY